MSLIVNTNEKLEQREIICASHFSIINRLNENKKNRNVAHEKRISIIKKRIKFTVTRMTQ